MKQELTNTITERTKESMNSVICSVGTRAAAQTWLNVVSAQRIKEVTQVYIKELEGDIVIIQDLIALVGSDQGKQISGEEKATQVAEHAKEAKQQGALYCDCPACTAAAYILEKKGELLKAVRDKQRAAIWFV